MENVIWFRGIHYLWIRCTDYVGADGKKNQSKSVTIDDHVWIGAKSTVLKGTYIGRDVVVAAGSIVHGKYKQTSCVIGGNPAVVIKNEITWDIGCPDR